MIFRVNDNDVLKTFDLATKQYVDDSGVYVGTTTPTGNQQIWIDPSGSADPIVNDVQIDGTSITSNGVANIPKASQSDFGVVKLGSGIGVMITNAGTLYLDLATNNQVKAGTERYKAIVPSNQHLSAFYGLAKAAGDSTQGSSSNSVGTYTETAKSAIRAMLGVEGAAITIDVTGATPTIIAQPNVRYVCGEVTSISITPPALGTCDVIFTSGSTVAVLTLPNTVKMPNWFDAANLETNTIYEINIVDGVYGAVMTWQNS